MMRWVWCFKMIVMHMRLIRALKTFVGDGGKGARADSQGMTRAIWLETPRVSEPEALFDARFQ